ncbi:superoxide dismutase family protein [Nonomuraea roseoviolacea]|uniref:Cu-Zn family superoxide dismutase n=1 Tax=Nonomuraea roseoviolacea subsp. carminata TaxID=160689 RepID=A0ABT1K7Z0_9ACTN|nr:superoxide dismutase family protein [Nonomuraea roseoviolacea]MCP2349129.1 Cu-Zn family superoxide dismutase [Nonomuraea roseoviolacea subsp. carminata]
MPVPIVLLAVLAAGCAPTTAGQAGTAQTQESPAQEAAAHTPSPEPTPGGKGAAAAAARSGSLSSSGNFTADGKRAVVYARKLAPEGARASITVESSSGQTLSSLVVEGLLPNRPYGAHLHTKPCGPKADDAGPHYQHEKGEVSAANEVWLDFTTDASGAGRATARNPWTFSPGRRPHSLVIHAKPTTAAGPKAGEAGERVACLTLG